MRKPPVPAIVHDLVGLSHAWGAVPRGIDWWPRDENDYSVLGARVFTPAIRLGHLVIIGRDRLDQRTYRVVKIAPLPRRSAEQEWHAELWSEPPPVTILGVTYYCRPRLIDLRSRGTWLLS